MTCHRPSSITITDGIGGRMQANKKQKFQFRISICNISIGTKHITNHCIHLTHIFLHFAFARIVGNPERENFIEIVQFSGAVNPLWLGKPSKCTIELVTMELTLRRSQPVAPHHFDRPLHVWAGYWLFYHLHYLSMWHHPLWTMNFCGCDEQIVVTFKCK